MFIPYVCSKEPGSPFSLLTWRNWSLPHPCVINQVTRISLSLLPFITHTNHLDQVTKLVTQKSDQSLRRLVVRLVVWGGGKSEDLKDVEKYMFMVVLTLSPKIMVQWKLVVFEPAARAFRRNTGLPTHNFRNLAPYQGARRWVCQRGDVPLIRYQDPKN